MTRTYALKRLLEHGPLTRAEITAITGWPAKTVKAALRQTLMTDVVRRVKGYNKTAYFSGDLEGLT